MPELRFRVGKRRYLLPVAALRPGNQSDLTFITATALLDTGATVSGIGPRIIDQLTLKTSGKNRLGSATEEAFVDYYLFRLGLFSSEQRYLDHLGPGDLPFIFEEIDGFSWRRQTDFDVILGMDVLSRCEVHLDRSGICRIQFGT